MDLELAMLKAFLLDIMRTVELTKWVKIREFIMQNNIETKVSINKSEKNIIVCAKNVNN